MNPEFKFNPAQVRARDVLISDAIHVALYGGARSGKTFLIVRQIYLRALRAPGSRHLITRFRFNSCKQAIWRETMPEVQRLCFPGLPSLDSMTDKTDWFVKLPNDSEIWIGGLDDKDRVEKILGKEYATIYANESSQIPWHSIVTARSRLAQKTILKNKFFYDFNPPTKKHWTFKVFVDKVDPEDMRPYNRPQDIGFATLNPIDNMENLSENFMQILDEMPERARKRFKYGLFADDAEGALWTEEILSSTRKLGHVDDPLPRWVRIIVAVDPSGTKGPEDIRSDEIGITVLALGTDGQGYLLEDLSGRYSPEGWGEAVEEAFHRHKADMIVGEKNFGGDMVRATIQARNKELPFTEVTATRGKEVRAEPISALYERGRLHHVGFFPEIEEQMINMLQSGYVGIKSPDRLDSVVWGFTYLFPGLTQQAKVDDRYDTPKVQSAPRGMSRYSK